MHLNKLNALIAGFAGAWLGSFLTFNSLAAVVVTRPTPAPTRGAWTDDLETLDVDFNQDGTVDFRLLSGWGFMNVYLDGTNRIVVRASGPPGTPHVDYSGVVSLPPGSEIGTGFTPNPGNYFWWTGFTNRYDLTQPYGTYEATAMLAGYTDTPLGLLTDKEGMIPVEFRINDQVHYGYIHFDFRMERIWSDGSGGYIYGWAYEDAPGASIIAEPIVSGPPVKEFKITAYTPWPAWAGEKGVGLLEWNTVVGETNRVQASENLVTWANISTNIVANRDSMFFITPPSSAAQRFFRIVREN